MNVNEGFIFEEENMLTKKKASEYYKFIFTHKFSISCCKSPCFTHVFDKHLPQNLPMYKLGVSDWSLMVA